MLVDCHTHIGRNHHINSSVDDLLKSMDKAGVDKSLVFAGKLNDCPNNYLYDQLKGHRDRLYGIAAWHPDDANLIDDRHRLFDDIDEGKVVGVKFYLGYDHWYPHDHRIYDILGKLQKSNVPAIFHCGDCLSSVNHAKLKYAHPLGIDEVAVDYPNLKIVIAHVGFPWVIDTAEVCYKNKNVYTDISGFVYGNFDDDSKFKFQKMIDQFTDIASSDKLLFGTDFPISNQKSYVESLDGIFNPTYLSENVIKVFNLKVI